VSSIAKMLMVCYWFDNRVRSWFCKCQPTTICRGPHSSADWSYLW